MRANDLAKSLCMLVISLLAITIYADEIPNAVERSPSIEPIEEFPIQPAFRIPGGDEQFTERPLEKKAAQEPPPDPEELLALLPRCFLFDQGEKRSKSAEEKAEQETDVENLNRALEIDSENPRLYRSRGWARINLRQFNEAIVDFTRRIELEPKQGEAFEHRAQAYVYFEKYAEAIADLKRAAELDPDRRAVILTWLALLHKKLGDEKQATIGYAEASKLDAGLIDRFVLATKVAYRLKQMDRAISMMSVAVGLAPTRSELLFERAQFLLLVVQQPQKAIDDCDALEKLGEHSAELYLLRGSAFRTLGDYRKALIECDRALQVEPANRKAHLNKALCSYRLGDNNVALQECNEAIRLDSTDDLAFHLRAKCYLRLNSEDEAIADFRSAILLQPEDPYLRASLAYRLAISRDESVRDANSAIQYAKSACALSDWKEPRWLAVLATAYASAGDFTKAIEWQEKAISLSMDETDQNKRRQALDFYKKNQRPWESKEQSSDEPD